MSDKITQVNVGSLVAHPMNRKLYGEEPLDKGFLASVRELGIIEPVTILTMPSLDGAKGNRVYVLSGHRRFLAAKRLGIRKIPARHADLDPNDPVAVEQFLIEANRQRVKTPEQTGREIMELRRIEAVFARDRQKLSKGRGVKGRAILPHLKGKARDIAAEKVGMGARTADKLLKVIEAADAGNEKARRALDAVNDRKMSIDKAYNDIK
jgi:ParB-like chromosome segregation protein Spo0J